MIQNLRPYLRMLLLLALPFGAGCGQSLSIRVERIKQVPKESISKFALNTGQQHELAAIQASVAEMTITTRAVADQIEPYFRQGAAAKLSNLRSASDQNRTDLIDATNQFGADELRLRAVGELGRLEDLKQFAKSATSTANPLNLDPNDFQRLADMVPEIERHKSQMDGKFAAIEAQLDRLMYGGYRSESIYLINPGSAAYDELVDQQNSNRPKLVYSKVEAVAAGDSVLLAVQENPAYFTMRYVSADPTEVIRNMLIATNRVLRVAAAFVPAVSGVAGALGTATPSGTSAPTGNSASPAATNTESSMSLSATEIALTEFDNQLSAVLNDAQLRDAVARLVNKPDELSSSDRMLLFSKMKELETALGKN